MFGLSIGMAIRVACITCQQSFPVWEDEDIKANQVEFRKKPSLKICPGCFHSVAHLDVISTPKYSKRWKKAASKFFRQQADSLTS